MAPGATSATTLRNAGPLAMSVSMSMATTSSPESLRCAASHWPTNPLPPVISARIGGTLLRGAEGHLIGLDMLGHAGGPRVPGGHRKAEAAPSRPLGRLPAPYQARRERLGQGAVIPRPDQAGRPLRHFGHRRTLGGDQRRPAGQRLDGGQAEPPLD